MKTFGQSFLFFFCVCLNLLQAEQDNVLQERPPNYTGKWKTTLPDGNIFESEFVNGVAHGKSFIWDKTGRLVRECYNLNGKMHGVLILYNKNTDIEFIRIYENGKTNREIHYDNGKIIADGQYKDGKCWNGIFRDWHYKNGQKFVYHEIREGKPWNGQFWLPLPDSTYYKDPLQIPPEYSNIPILGMGDGYGGTVEPYDPTRGIPKQVTFNEGKIVEEILEHQPPDTTLPEKVRFDIGWPISNSGEWLLEDWFKLDYAIDHLEEYTNHPEYEDIKYKTIARAKEFACFRLPNPKAWQFLIESNVLKDGLTLEQARILLGRLTHQEDGFVSWYYNPDGFHIAPCLVAEMREDKLYNWTVTKR